MMDCNSWRHITVAVVELNTTRVDVPNHVANMVHSKRNLHRRLAHTLASGISHLRFLQMELSAWEIMQGARMIEMQVGDDDVLYRTGIDTDLVQHLMRLMINLTTATRCFFSIETRIYQYCPVFVSDYPNIISNWARRRVIIVVHEVLFARSVWLPAIL